MPTSCHGHTRTGVRGLLVIGALALSLGGPAIIGPTSAVRAQTVHDSGGSSKPAPGPQPPIVAPRPATSGGSLDGASLPARGAAPTALRQTLAAAIQAQAGKPLQPAAPAANLPAHGTVIGALPTAKTSSTSGPAAPANPANKPLLIPAPSGHSPAAPQYPGALYNSTEVDNNTACGFGVNETTIAQSSANPNLLVAGANTYENGDGSCGDSHAFAYYSHDGGQHWQQTILPGLTFQASGDPAVTYDPVHQVFVYSFLEFDRTDSGGRVGVEVSSDGQNWALNTSLDTNPSDGSYGVDKDMITVDQNPSSPHYGRVAVSWTEFHGNTSWYLDAYSDDGGNSWHRSATTVNYLSDGCGNGTSPAFDANGDLMVAWFDCSSGNRLMEELSTDGGATWPAPSDTVITGINDIESAGSDGGCLMDNGGTAFRCNSFPSLAGDPNAADTGGQAFEVVWANADTVSGSTISIIHGIGTTDGGATWNGGNGFGFNYMSFVDDGDKFFPWIAFSPNGRLNMGYSDREDNASSGNPNGTSFDEWMTEASSFDAIHNHSSYITYVADGTLASPGSSTFIGDYAGTTSLDNNFDTFPIWTDERTGASRARTMDLCYVDCYTFLQPFTPLSIGHGAGSSFTDLYQYNTDTSFGGSGSDYWNAVGIREGADGTSVDDDTYLYGDRYFSNLLTSSTYGPPYNDYTLENDNFGHGPTGPYFPQVHNFSGSGGSYSIEWAAGHIVLGTSYGDSMAANSVVRVYDTSLATGTQYYIGLRPASGNTSNYRLTLHSASRGNQQGSSNAVANSGNVAPGQPAFVSYNTGADPTQYDGVVVLNNNGGAGSYTLYRDTAAPSGTVALDGGATSTNNPSVTLTLNATNPTSGDPVVDMAIACDGVNYGAFVPYASSATCVVPAGDGSKTVLVQYRNGAGAVSSPASASILLDTTPPHTAASLSGSSGACGYSGAVQVTLSATDGGSGVASTVYQVDGGAVTPYSGPFSVGGAGSHTVTFHSTDNAGNVESTQSTSFTVVGPAAITRSPSGGVYLNTVTVTGTNFGASETVKLYFDSTASTALATTTSTAGCGFVTTFTVPEAISGTHTIIAKGFTSGLQATAPFQVKSTLIDSGSLGYAGTQVVAKGHGFGSGEPIKLYWDKVGGLLLGTTTANSLGGWGGASAISFTVPMSPSGTTYPVIAVGQNTGWRASAQFTIATFLHLAWSSGAAIPNAHVEAAGAVANNKLYAISGSGGDCTDGANVAPTTAVDIYNPSTNTWSSGPAVNVARNQDPVAVTVGSKIYLIGGTTGCGGATVTTVESLDLGTNVWTALPAASNLPATLTGNNHCAAAAGTKIYYFQSAGIGVFDTTTNTWSVLPANPLLSPSQFCKAVPYGTNKIQISGPGDGSGDAFSQRVLTFDATSNTISVGARTTVSDAEHGSAVLHNQVVLTGGDFATTSVQVIDAQALWSVSALPSPRDDHLSGVVNGKLYLFGGESGATTTPAVLIGTPS